MIHFLQQIFKEKKAFVAFKKPFENKVKCLVQLNANLYPHTWHTDGFIFYPFEDNELKIVFPYAFTESTEFDLDTFKSKHITKNPNLVTENLADKEKHLHLVQQAVNFIHQGNAEKIVVSRQHTLQNITRNPFEVFENLLFQYPEAFVYVWYHPQVALWIGATPEKLLFCHDKNIETMALAGTQTFQNQLVWQKKEITEQALVTHYLIEKLKPLVDLHPIQPVFTKKAGHLAHLCTKITGEVKENHNLFEIIQNLHPTPAVCGTPLQNAKKFIATYENYQRKYYTGFLGEYTSDSCDLYVNLRCAEWVDNQINIYVGGGITKDSIPANEWDETSNKLKVLSQFF